MTTYTETELATQTLRSAGILGIDETASAADLLDAKQSNRSVIGLMNALGVPIWNGSEIAVPEEYLVELGIRLSLPIRLSNGLINETQYLQLIEESERRLTVLAAPRGSTPLLTVTNESTGGRAVYNWQTGR